MLLYTCKEQRKQLYIKKGVRNMGGWKQRAHNIVIPQLEEAKVKCPFCEKVFALKTEQHYICREEYSSGGISGAMAGNKEPLLYDCWDCPRCGTQIRGERRLRKYYESIDEVVRYDI